MLCELDFYDIRNLLDGLGYENESDIIADYIEECCADGWNIKQWVNNTDFITFKDKEKALEFVKENGLNEDSLYCGVCGCFVDLDYD